MSDHHQYYADRILSEFALRGRRNINGWGIGSYIGETANVLRSADPALTFDRQGENLSREFSVAINAVSSPLILGHLRLTSRGSNIPENNHPFKLHFLDYDWLLIHNGSASPGICLVPHEESLLTESNNDSARVFEFLRRKIIDYCVSDIRKSLIEGVRKAFTDLISFDQGGTFNLILSNGYISLPRTRFDGQWKHMVHWTLERGRENGKAI